MNFNDGTLIKFGEFSESRKLSISIKAYPGFIAFDAVEFSGAVGTYLPANISVDEAKRVHEALGLAIASVEEGLTK
ncbi:hypothetical protein ACGFZC_16310 [[Kitasatospora] papulosa]|uniref:hypothetical protein n=1 Tax=[Kitasatospora] papulosa TaxID=1464011 RepID=UPI00371663D0